jgi:hypothetical protein
LAYSLYNLTSEELAHEVNNGKDLILDQLSKDGIITNEQLKNYKLYYGFVIGEPSYFSRLWQRICPTEYNKKIYMLVKLLNVSSEKESEIIDISKPKGDQ